MHIRPRYAKLYTVIFWLVVTLTTGATISIAASNSSANLSVDQYDWLIVRWSNNQIVCQFIIDHEGLPTRDEVRSSCGQITHNEWINTSVCVPAQTGEGDTRDCSGLYLLFNNIYQLQQPQELIRSNLEIIVSLLGCDPQYPDYYCETLPSINIQLNPMFIHQDVMQLQGNQDGEDFTCIGTGCIIDIEETDIDGIHFEFWAMRNDGTSGIHYNAILRVLPMDTISNNYQAGYFVELISTQFNASQVPCCSQVWQSFSTLLAPAVWLTSPQTFEELATENDYYYLAGRLIQNGYVNASVCPNGGLESNSYATECGLERARDEMILWQNSFDEYILRASQNTGVPAWLLKNLFGQESQFWPGDYGLVLEYGLGHLTDRGADTLLLWNPQFYRRICVLEFGVVDECLGRYDLLTEGQQGLLRGSVANHASTYCRECPSGLDLSQINYSVEIFAYALEANAYQVGQIIQNITNRPPGLVSSYEDLWRFTLVNYNAGAGCLAEGIRGAWTSTGGLTWNNVAIHLSEDCQGAVDYVENLTGLSDTP